MMPYSAFAKAVEARRYDVEALARQFGTSFEQTAHRLTTLQKPGHERVPFFFIRVDPAGNVSKRLDGAGFPFAKQGGGCPLWSVHGLPHPAPDRHPMAGAARRAAVLFDRPHGDGRRRRVRPARVERAIALGCAAEHAGRLIYTGGARGCAPRGDTDRRHMPPLPPAQMRRTLGAADRARNPAR